MKAKKLPFRKFKYIYSKVPRLCVDLIVKNGNGVLLTKRDILPDKGWWHLPGGTVLMGEKLHDTAKRIAQEELNTKIKIIKHIGFLEYTDGSGAGQPISIVFLVKPLSRVSGSKQAKEVVYFTKLPPKTLPEVRKYLKKNFTLS